MADFREYVESMQQAWSNQDNKKIEYLESGYGDNKVSYKEAEETIASVVDGLIKYSSEIKVLSISQFSLLLKYLEKDKLFTPNEINELRKAQSILIDNMDEEGKKDGK